MRKPLAWLVFTFAALFHGHALAYSVNTTDDGEPIRWSVDAVGLRLDPALEAWLPPGDAFAAISMAFDAWRGLPRVPDLVIKEGEPGRPGYHEGHASNGVYLVEHWEHAPQKLAVTVVTFELETGRLLDADVLINPNVAYTLLGEEQGEVPGGVEYDLAAVMTHEAGHILGLGESEDVPDATMWPYANPGDVHQRTLSEDDEEGAIDAYAGPPPAPAAGCGAMRVSDGGRHGSMGGVLLLALAALGLLARRRAGMLWPGLCMGLTGLVLLPAGNAPTPPRAQVLAEGPAVSEVQSAADRELQALRQFAGAATRIELGQLERFETRLDDGLMRTRYTLRNADGSLRELSVAGGDLDGVGQRVVGEPAPPRHGASVAVAAQPDGKVRWAYHADGRLHGGDLGEHAVVALSAE